MLNKDFLRQVFVEEKSLLPLADVKWIEVPKYQELSVVNIFPRFKKDAEVMSYIPDRLPKGRLPDRVYFFNVLHTIHPEFVKEMVTVANNNRHEAKSASVADGVIKVSDEWWQKLTEIPFVSGKSFCHSNSSST